MAKRSKSSNQLLSEVRIRGFRGLDDLDVRGMTAVTLVTGRNNVGKTSFLEALFLASAPLNPALTLSVNVPRGLQSLPQLDVHVVWAWLFAQTKQLDSFSIETLRRTGPSTTRAKMDVGMRQSIRSLTLRSLGDRSGADGGSAIVRESSAVPKQLAVSYASGRTRRKLVVEAHENMFRAVEGEMGDVPGQLVCQYLALDALAGSPSHGSFTRVVNEGRLSTLIAGLRPVEPRLLSIEILGFGSTDMLHANLGDGPRIPIVMMGHGFSLAVRVFLAIESVRGGLLLIDEVGAGLHHTALRPFWEAVIPFARQRGVQIIATTHSRECLDAAAAADAQGPGDDVSLIRIDRDERGVEAVRYSEAELGEAARRGIEVR